MMCEACQELLIDLAAGELDEVRAVQVRQHLEACSVCSEALARMQRTRALFASAIEEGPSAGFDAPILAAAREEALRAMAGRAAAASAPMLQQRLGHAEQMVQRRSREIGLARSTRWRRALFGGSVAAAAALAVVVSTRESIQARFAEVYTDRSSRPLLPAEEKPREASAKQFAPAPEQGADRLAVLAPDRRPAAQPTVAAAPVASKKSAKDASAVLDSKLRADRPLAAPALVPAAGLSALAASAGEAAAPAKVAAPRALGDMASSPESPATAAAASAPVTPAPVAPAPLAIVPATRTLGPTAASSRDATSVQSEGERAPRFEPGLAKSAPRSKEAPAGAASAGRFAQPASAPASAAAEDFDSAPASSVASAPADQSAGGPTDPSALERRAARAQRAGRLQAASSDFRAAARSRVRGDVAQAAADFVSAIECDAARGDIDAARSSRAELAALSPSQPAALATADQLIAAARSDGPPR